MQVSAVSGETAAARTSTERAAQIDYDAFLKLLVAEMSNQDPTNPMDSTEYVAQLASFSEVEQAIQTNGKLEELLSRSALSLAADLVGRSVTSADGAQSGVIAGVRITTSGPVAVLDGGAQIPVGPGVTIS